MFPAEICLKEIARQVGGFLALDETFSARDRRYIGTSIDRNFKIEILHFLP